VAVLDLQGHAGAFVEPKVVSGQHGEGRRAPHSESQVDGRVMPTLTASLKLLVSKMRV
jgi:hypothetical protein